ncbi:hypothetical protein IJV79_03105 [bacterium]|nr:hypothetical protein [bacterium]
MKKFFLIFCCAVMSALPSFASVRPDSVDDINPKSIGVYQAENSITIHKEANENSPVLLKFAWNEGGIGSADISERDVFTVFYPEKNLAFFSVMDENDDLSWVQIVYNHNKTGWIKVSDTYRYTNWRNFFNNYGRKYGLTYLRDAAPTSKTLYGSPDESSTIITTVTLPKAIKLTNISGNWALCIIYDIDHTQKIGWLRWRTTDGHVFLFPALR